MFSKATCTRCSASLSVPDGLTGKWVRCPRCRERFLAAEASTAIFAGEPSDLETAVSSGPPPRWTADENPEARDHSAIVLDPEWGEILAGLRMMFWCLLGVGVTSLLYFGQGHAEASRFPPRNEMEKLEEGHRLIRRVKQHTFLDRLVLWIGCFGCIPTAACMPLYLIGVVRCMADCKTGVKGWLIGHAACLGLLILVGIGRLIGVVQFGDGYAAVMRELGLLIGMLLAIQICLALFLRRIALELAHPWLCRSCESFLMYECVYSMYLCGKSYFYLSARVPFVNTPIVDPVWWAMGVISLTWTLIILSGAIKAIRVKRCPLPPSA